MKEKIIYIQYPFKIEYEHKDHLKRIVKDLKEKPIEEMIGAGTIDHKTYAYRCTRKGKGKINDKGR